MRFHFNSFWVFIFFVIPVIAQQEWVLKKDKEGIQVFNGKAADSKFKIIRVTCVLDASISQLAAVLLATSRQPEWVIATKSSTLLKTLESSRIYYYTEIELPWPVSNRDMVAEMSITQNPVTKNLTIRANNINHIFPEKKGKVRIPFSQAVWEVTPIAKDKIKIDYSIKLDPGGGIPAWLVNLFTTNGPFETFQKLKIIIQDKQFQNRKFDFIKE